MINQLIEHFDIWTDAQGIKSKNRVKSVDNISLEGIARLRELILELAIQGKLTEQDPNDEPASELLKRIAKEKKKNTPKIRGVYTNNLNENECPFKLPQNWIWSQLGDLGIAQTGSTPKTANPDYFKGDIPFIGPGQIDKNGSITSPDKFLSQEGCQFSTIANQGDIIMVCIGGSIGKCGIVSSQITFNQQLNSISPLFILTKYLFNALNSTHFQQNLLKKSTGSATPIINRSKWESIMIPVPPLAEQHRIVAKVEELMSLCDQLEEQKTNHLKTHEQLVKSLLQSLTQAANATELETAWERMSAHFDTLFCTEDSIEQLKQTILQLAVMGKLVKQNPSDEPASVLLKKIAKEKEVLIKEGKIKKQAKLPEIGEDEKPFELPKGWEWVRPDDFSIKITDGEHFRPPTQKEGVYFLSAKDIRSEGVSLEDPLYISKEIAEVALQRCNPEKGDILIVSRGATVGRMCTVDIEEVFCLLGSVILIKPIHLINNDFLKIVMKSPQAFNKLIAASGSTAQPAIYLRDLKKIAFPIAPIQEQLRIVSKVEELFCLCELLKERVLRVEEVKGRISESFYGINR